MAVKELTKLVLDKATEMERLCSKRNDLNYQAMNLKVIQPISEELQRIKSSSLEGYEINRIKKLNNYINDIKNLSREEKANYNTLTLKEEICKLRYLVD